MCSGGLSAEATEFQFKADKKRSCAAGCRWDERESGAIKLLSPDFNNLSKKGIRSRIEKEAREGTIEGGYLVS